MSSENGTEDLRNYPGHGRRRFVWMVWDNLRGHWIRGGKIWTNRAEAKTACTEMEGTHKRIAEGDRVRAGLGAGVLDKTWQENADYQVYRLEVEIDRRET